MMCLAFVYSGLARRPTPELLNNLAIQEKEVVFPRTSETSELVFRSQLLLSVESHSTPVV